MSNCLGRPRRHTIISVGAKYVPSTGVVTKLKQHRRSALQDRVPFQSWCAFSLLLYTRVAVSQEGQANMPQPLRSQAVRLDYALADLP